KGIADCRLQNADWKKDVLLCVALLLFQSAIFNLQSAIVMVVLIDNYDSFTYNLVQRLGELDAGLDVRVYRNDQITPDEVGRLAPSHIIISPGPCTPREAGVSNEVLRAFAPTVPILGVCLGHQCIGHVFGGEVVRNERIMHGKTSPI